MQPIGYGVSWQVPLYDPTTLAGDAAEAAYVSAKPGVQTVEFGNEPNLYPNISTEYQTYINQWDTIYQDYKGDGGAAPVSGPGGAKSGSATYVTDFLADDAGDLSALTAHFYDGSGNKPTATCQNLLTVSPLQSFIEANVALAKSCGLPFIMSETNTYAEGGSPGVSNAFCSALWAADYTLFALEKGVANLDFHGVADYPPGNKDGLIEYFWPIRDDGTPAPEYYGLLFYHEMTQAGGHMVATTSTNAANLDAYGVVGTDGKLRIALVNRSSGPYTVAIHTDQSYTHAEKVTLKAPALSSTAGVTFGGVKVATDGTWSPKPARLGVNGTSSRLTVPADSATVITYSNG